MVTKEFPTEPPASPETAIATTQSLQILADSTNGTIFYDVDAKSHSVIKDFSSESNLPGKSVRIAARYQEDGTLVATRIWASSQFNNVWLSPEGHVLHVDAGSNVVTVANESGGGVDLTVDANTQFFFRQPQNPAADSAPIATGTAFLANHELVRGFKVHASVVDPLATPLVAQTIDIETAVYDGKISAPGTTGFTLTRLFGTAKDDYVYTLNYIADATPNGMDDNGNAINGYKWWNFAYPTLVTSGADAIADFISATDGSVNFGGSMGSVPSRGISFATVERSCQPQWLVSGGEHPDALAAAAGIRGHRPREQFIHDDRHRRRQCGDGGCESHVGLRDAGVSGGLHGRHRDRQPDRHHDQRRTCHSDHGTCRRRAGEGVRGAAAGWDAEGLCAGVFHGTGAGAIVADSTAFAPTPWPRSSPPGASGDARPSGENPLGLPFRSRDCPARPRRREPEETAQPATPSPA